LITEAIVFVLGVLILPFVLGLIIMFSDSSKKRCLRLLTTRRSHDGFPRISIIRASWSPSDSPGNRGYPVYSSARMHPKLHMSIAPLNLSPRITSGAL